MKSKKDVAVYFSLLLSAANILGSSGLMVWIDHAIQLKAVGLSAYYPLVSYLLGLSFGCCLVGLISAKDIRAVSNEFFLVSLVFAFCICFALSMGEGVFYNWFGLFLRFLWGLASGCTVILGRSMLASSERSSYAQKNFSILSLALATLPLIVPMLFAFLGFYQRSISAICASLIYAITIIFFLLSDVRIGVGDSWLVANDRDSRVGVGSCISLIVLNVCFFLTLMLVPMVRVLSFPNTSLVYLYLIVLCLWMFFGWLIVRYCQYISVRLRLRAGYILQSIMLACCYWMLFWGDYFIFVFMIFLIFLSSMLIQPILFSFLGRHSRGKLLLFGVQSGLYVFIVCVVLMVAVFFVFSIKAIVWLLSGFIVLSLTCFNLFLTNYQKTNV